MKQVYNSFDRSTSIKNLIKWLSTTLATKRGLPVLIAIVLTFLSLIVHLIAALSGSLIVGICGIAYRHYDRFPGRVACGTSWARLIITGKEHDVARKDHAYRQR